MPQEAASRRHVRSGRHQARVDSRFRVKKVTDHRRILFVPMVFDDTTDYGLILFRHSSTSLFVVEATS
jgi:hypothetical protein